MDSLQLIPLRQLRLSPLNVRQTDPDEGIEDLAQSILVHGLQQNLIGYRAPDADDPLTIEIAAGGRRLQALQRLVRLGEIPETQAVAVQIIDRDEAREISLLENERVALNPADEYLAFKAIVDDHAGDVDPIGLCARRQGCSELRVRRALRLAALAPEILDALRDGTIGIEAARAYASISDHAVQLIVFNAEERRTLGTKHRPLEIRMALSTKTYPIDSLKPRYVGLAAFRAAGGEVDHDLFTNHDRGGVISQTALLDTMATAKAEADLPALVSRHGFREGLLSPALAAHASWPPAPRGWLQVQHRRPIEQAPRKGRGRVDCIGVYALAETEAHGPVELTCIGWYPKRDIPAEAGLAPAAPPAVLPSLERPAPRQQTGGELDETVLSVRYRDAEEKRLHLAAAHLAVERVITAIDLRAATFWPQPHALVPAIAPGPEEDTFDVAMIVRVRRADLEQLLGEARELIEEGEQANDHVAAAEAGPVPISGGGGEEPSSSSVKEGADVAL